MSRLGRGFPNNSLMRAPRAIIPVSYDATGAGSKAHSTTLSWNHTIAPSAAVIVGMDIQTSSAPTVTAQVGSAPMAQLEIFEYYTPTPCYVVVFGLLNPPTGAQTITATSSLTAYMDGNSVSYLNVGSFGTVATTSGSSTALSQTVAATTGGCIFQMFGQQNATGGTTLSGYSQTLRFSQPEASGINDPYLMGDAPGSSSVNFAATSSAAQGWGGAAVPMLPMR